MLLCSDRSVLFRSLAGSQSPRPVKTDSSAPKWFHNGERAKGSSFVPVTTLIAYRRQKGDRSLLFVANLSDNACPITFPLPEKEPLLTSWERELSPRPAGQLRPYEAMLWEE